MDRFSAYRLYEKEEGAKSLINDIISYMDDPKTVGSNLGVDGEIDIDKFIEEAEDNLKEFMDKSEEDMILISYTEESGTKEYLRSIVHKEAESLRSIHKTTLNSMQGVRDDIKRLETSINQIDSSIKLADLSEDKTVNISKLNKHITIINQDINRYKKIISYYMKNSVKIAGYISKNELLLDGVLK